MKTTFGFFLFYFIACPLHIFGQASWHWAANEVTPPTGFNAGKSVCTDTEGNVIVSGYFRSTSVTFGSITLTNVDPSGNTEDAFTVKYDPGGNVLWAKSAGGTGREWINSVCADADGNIFITGWFEGPSFIIDADTLVTSGWADVFIAKYDPNGNVLWSRSATGAGYEESFGICTDADGNTYITGNFVSSTIAFGSHILVNSAPPMTCDLFVVKFDTAGNVLWARRGDGPGDNLSQSISADSWGNVFIAGGYYGTMAFGSSLLLYNNNQSVYSPNAFIAKYDTNGNILWAKSAGQPDYADQSYSVSTDGSGSAYITGFFYTPSISFDSVSLSNAGYADIFIAKYDSIGNVVWAKRAGGPSDETGYAVAADSAGTVFITGQFSEPACTFGALVVTTPVNGYIPLFLVKYDGNGNAICGSALESAGNQKNGIIAGDTGTVFLCGAFGAPQLTLGSTVLTLTGSSSAFAAKYSCEDEVSSLSEWNSEEAVTVFPNPTSGKIFLHSTHSAGTVLVTNALGEIVYSSVIENPSLAIDLSNQAEGIYFYEIIGENSRSGGKIIVAH